MGNFQSELIIREAPDCQWVLAQPLEYKGNRDTFIVPVGFATDFASVPRAFWSLFPPYGRHTKAAVLHDFLYVAQITSRKDADGIFLRVMKELGTSWVRRRIMHRAVRLAGWGPWKSARQRQGQLFDFGGGTEL